MTPISNVETLRLADWSGFTDFGGSAQVYTPRNEHEIVDLVHHCRQQRLKLRVVGLQTSWNTLWYSEDVMMTSKYLDRIIDIDAVNHTITCESGATLEQIHKALWERGLTLERAPAVDWVTVGGSISTGSHGSGPASSSSAMIGCRLITADGNILEIGEHDELLDAVRISVGALGILSTITLRVVDRFYVYMQRTQIPTRDWKRYLYEGEMSYLLWFPHTDSSVFARVEKIMDPAEASRRASQCSSQGFDPNDPEDRKRLGVDIKEYTDSIAGLANVLPSTFPARNRFLLDVFFQDIEKVGPAYEILMSFESDPIAGGEWSVPVDRFEAAFAELQRETTEGDLFLPIVWLKKVKGESAWLSAADGDCVQCGIYHSLVQGTPTHVKDMVMRVERIMLRHGGRPHLGKLIYLTPTEMRQAYPLWDRFNTLRKQMDADGMFWTRSLAAIFGDGEQMSSNGVGGMPAEDRIPGVMADTVVRLFARGEAMDSQGFATFFTDNPMYQFGNGEPCLNKAAIIDSVTAFFGMVDALYHDIRNIWEEGDTVFVEMDVTYWRKDGTSITLPCADIFRFAGDKVQELRIFMDANPMFNRSMAVGDKASVMTISEGRRVVPPGIMRKFFAEHGEGVQRVANGYAPKWATAGPRWPIGSNGEVSVRESPQMQSIRMQALTDFQSAMGAGNWDLAKSLLTRNAVLRVGNRQEVVGPQAISETVRDLFSRELRADNADFTGVWEPGNNVLVVEMNVQATRMSDGKHVDYPCVETYRFDGPKISEWRIYPLEPTLLAKEGWR